MGRILSGVTLALALGCQSGSSGTLRLAVAFPAFRTAAVPPATTMIPVVVDQNGVSVASTVLTRDQSKAVLASIPAGALTVYAAAIGSDMTVLALGKATTKVTPGQLSTASVEMLPILVFGQDERQGIMASVRRGFPIEFGLSIKPLPPGDDTQPGSLPSSRPVGGDLQLGTLTAQPPTVPVNYPVVLSVTAGPDTAALGLWDWQWQVAGNDGTLPPGRFSPTRLINGRAESVWTPEAPGTYVLRVTVGDGLRTVTSNDVQVTVVSGSAGGTVGGNF